MQSQRTRFTRTSNGSRLAATVIGFCLVACGKDATTGILDAGGPTPGNVAGSSGMLPDPVVTPGAPGVDNGGSKVADGGYFSSGTWAGYAWVTTNAATATPSDFASLKAGEPLCISGSVKATNDWSGIAMLGVNLNQAFGDDTPIGTIVPAKDGITVQVTNKGGSPLRVQIQGPSGATDENDRWCAAIAGSGGTIPYSRFNTRCWDDSGEAYQGQPLASAAILVPGSNTQPTGFDFCLNELADGATATTEPTDPPAGNNDGKGVVGYYGELYCGEGSKLHGSKTSAVAQVRGMSFFWSNWSSALWRNDVIDRMVDEFKSEIVRLPLGVSDTGTPYNWADEQLVRDMIDHARTRGIYVIIDWHSHGADQNVSAAKEYFGRMAKDYGHLDNVIFEIFNEPINQTWDQVKAYAEQVIPVIREHSDNLILVGTPMYSQQVGWAAGNPLSDKNVAYVLHFYAKSHSGWLRTEGNTALNAGKCLFVSEWGATHADGGQVATGNTGIDYGSTEEWLGWMDTNNISWANWSIMNKAESSSIFNAGTETLSEDGNYLKKILNGYVESNPWR